MSNIYCALNATTSTASNNEAESLPCLETCDTRPKRFADELQCPSGRQTRLAWAYRVQRPVTSVLLNSAGLYTASVCSSWLWATTIAVEFLSPGVTRDGRSA